MISPRAVRLFLWGFAMLLTLDAAASLSRADSAVPPNAEDLLQRIAPLAPDDCSEPSSSSPSSEDADELENKLFESVKALVADRLNNPPLAISSDVESRATSALREVEQSSSTIDKTWPVDDRFGFKVLVLPPAILVEMTYRSKAEVVLYASYDLDKNESTDPGTRWREVDLDDQTSPSSEIDMFPLRRGPSGHVRFLTEVWHSGCAGSLGQDYYGYDWSPGAGQSGTEIIKIEGAEGLDESESKQVGRLSTTGKTIQLPYCFFSAVDTWDNPTLCAADSFDLSGEDARFIGRVYNTPDLVTVAKVVQYAGVHDYAAVRGYCASDAVARKLVREMPPYLFADTVDTVKGGADREAISLVDGAVRFDLIKRRGLWLVESFKMSGTLP
jgi:hypothetical protein